MPRRSPGSIHVDNEAPPKLLPPAMTKTVRETLAAASRPRVPVGGRERRRAAACGRPDGASLIVVYGCRARRTAAEVGYPVVFKAVVPGFAHKSDAGLVATGTGRCRRRDGGLRAPWWCRSPGSTPHRVRAGSSCSPRYAANAELIVGSASRAGSRALPRRGARRRARRIARQRHAVAGSNRDGNHAPEVRSLENRRRCRQARTQERPRPCRRCGGNPRGAAVTHPRSTGRHPIDRRQSPLVGPDDYMAVDALIVPRQPA